MDDDARDALLVRLDERTASTHSLLEQHLKDDREDFRGVHDRITVVKNETAVTRRIQAWMAGVAACLVFVAGVVGTFLRFGNNT